MATTAAISTSMDYFGHPAQADHYLRRRPSIGARSTATKNRTEIKKRRKQRLKTRNK